MEKGELGCCIKPEIEISTDTVPKAKYVIDKTYSLLNEVDSTPHIQHLGIYLTGNNLKTHGFICLHKRIKHVYSGKNAAVKIR